MRDTPAILSSNIADTDLFEGLLLSESVSVDRPARYRSKEEKFPQVLWAVEITGRFQTQLTGVPVWATGPSFQGS